MKRFCRGSLIVACISAALAVGDASALAAEVLNNLSLEDSAGPANWTATQFITGEPELPISVYEHVGQANHPQSTEGEYGLLLKPQAGNGGVYADQNKATNAIFSQTVQFGPSAAGRTYTLTGHSYFQTASSNNLTTLFPDSPSGEVASPTQTFFEIAFLNSSGAVVGTPARLDLPKNRATDVKPDDYIQHTLMSTAPATTTQIRVTVGATDMVASCTTGCPAGQDVNLDNFSLRDNVSSFLERLVNGNLNTLGAPSSWSIEKTAQDNISFTGSASFAAHSGNTGMWLRSFAGGDAKIVQTVPGVEGEDYTFTAWGKLQQGFSGLDPFASTVSFMTMEFLDGSNAVIGSPVTKNIATSYTWDPGEGGQGVWQPIGLPTTEAPAGTVNVRVSIGATQMANSGIDPQSAMFDDFSLMTSAVAPGLDGDFNDDGVVDAADYVVFRKNEGTNNALPNDGGLGTPIGSGHYNLWSANFGESGGGSVNLLGAAVPEPGSILLVGIALGLFGAAVRRGR